MTIQEAVTSIRSLQSLVGGAFDMDERRWIRKATWLAAEFDDQLVMLDVDSGTYFGLNETAAEIWKMLEQPHSPADLVDRLCRHFAVPRDRCRSAVDRTLRHLEEIGAISVA